MSQTNRHQNYLLLNLIGYGLAKFDMDFVTTFGFKTKRAFYQDMMTIGIADSEGTIKNRQDMLDPFFDNGRKSWWQRKENYRHRLDYIDSIYGDLEFASVVKAIIQEQGFRSYEDLKTQTPINI